MKGVFFLDEKELYNLIVKLLSENRLPTLRKILEESNVVDIAVSAGELETEQLLRVFRILPKDISSSVFSYLDPDDQTRLVESITDRELETLIDEMYIDDTIDFLEEVPANIVRRVLARADSQTRSIINRFLNYPEDSAGSIMTIEMVELHDNYTAKRAIEYIRETGCDKETVYTCFVIDAQRHLIGSVDLKDLLFCKENETVGKIMDDERALISVSTTDDREEVAEIARKYDLLSVPVVDNENRLVGIITIDDIIDVMEEAATEDIEKMHMLLPSEDDYLKTGVFTLVKNRIVWLLVLMISATFTSQIITGFEDKLAAVAGLTASIPMLTGTGGNAGNQVSSLIIRGIALGKIGISDYFKVLWKEIRVAVICGGILAIANLGRMFLVRFVMGGNVTTSVFFVTSLAMMLSVVAAKAIGCSLPIIAKLLHADPAVMSGPMLATLVDIITLLIYFGLASSMLTFA